MITWIIILATSAISYAAFQNPALALKLQFNAARVIHQKEYHRLLSHALIHANWTHLFVNMLVLYFFGRPIEMYLEYFFGNKSTAYFLLLYAGGILASNFYSLYVHRNNHYYNAVGASGAVSAVLFAFIFLNPWEKLYFFGLLPIPGIVFAPAYLIYSYYMGKKGVDNVAHDAHFLGAVFGFLFLGFLRPGLFERFFDQLFRLV